MLLVHEVKKKKNIIFFLCLIIFYIFWQSKSIYGGDAGDLVSTAFVLGVPHPPGYPLYSLLGWFLAQIPLFSVAWRLNFLSSIPAALSCFLIFKIISLFTKNSFYPLLAAFISAFVYPVYLYAQVPEIFSLLLFFVLILVYFSLLYRLKYQLKFLYLFAFFLGLSLTHHHLIFFLFPSFMLLIFHKNKKIKSLLNLKTVLKLVILFLLPLSLYLYVYLAAANNPPINWEDPVTIRKFIRLVSRESYGTFTSSPMAAYRSVLPRLLDVLVFLKFVYDDFGLLGIFLIPLGLVFLFKKNQTFFYGVVLSLLMLIFFIFYAAFPLLIDFNVATYERFILLPYIFLILTIGFGMIFFHQQALLLTKKFTNKRLKTTLLLGIKAIFAFYALGFFLVNFPSIKILKNDQTAENLGRDILAPLEPKSILILSEDTPLFDTQYVYYTQKFRNDVILIHRSKLFAPFYMKTLKKYYPSLTLSSDKNKGFKDVKDFIAKNYRRHPIYLNSYIEPKKGQVIPCGLLYKYYPSQKEIPLSLLVKKDESFWKIYQDPLAGSLKIYQNLMLADVLRVYSDAHTQVAKFYYDKNLKDKSAFHFKQAIKLQPETAQNHYYLGKIYFAQKKCQPALLKLKKAKELEPDHLDTYFMLGQVYANCLNDPQKAKFYKKQYLQKRQEQEGLLEKL